MEDPKDFDSYVIRGIIAKNEFGIRNVKKISTLQSRYFVQSELKHIEDLITAKKIDLIDQINNDPDDKNLFLYIMKVEDQENRVFIVTVFDSNDLSQDPQVIDIFPYNS